MEAGQRKKINREFPASRSGRVVGGWELQPGSELVWLGMLGMIGSALWIVIAAVIGQFWMGIISGGIALAICFGIAASASTK